MNRRTRTFRCPDTGETKVLTEDTRRIDVTTNFSEQVAIDEIEYYVSSDGDIIERLRDGSYRDDFERAWVPV